MNVSYRWLEELVPGLSEEPEEVARRLGLLGIPVDELRPLGVELGDIVIARVERAERHPDADRLSLCAVDAGTGELLSVVCGAPNVRAGGYYPFAPVGSTLPGDFKIRKAKIRGQESHGMLCSERELGLGREHAGIMELAGEYRPGERFVDAVGLDDVRFTLDVTPNRGDLLSHLGVARELAVGGEAGVRLPHLGGEAAQGAAQALVLNGSRDQPSVSVQAEGIRVSIEDAAGCSRYVGVVVRGVRIAPSPSWLSGRLRAVGLRPINNVVDVTNYILAELGQPLHAFDLKHVEGAEIRVRSSRAGETIVTLDGERRTLPEGALVIADARRPVAVAGVMGGAESEVGEATADLLLECAVFDPARVRSTRQALGLATEASQRFERGVDATGVERAVRRALELLVEVAGGTPVAAADACVERPQARPVPLRVKRVAAVLGLELDEPRVRNLLEEIGFSPVLQDGDLAFHVPGHRRQDVSREIDLIEEIARRHGYEQFPDVFRAFRPGTVPDDEVARLENALRAHAVGRGFLETRGLPFVPAAHGQVKLLLPLSAEEDHLRASVVPSLLRRVEHNFARGTRDVRLVEIGTVFAAAREPGALPLESTRIGLVFTGARSAPHWSAGTEPFDVWDLKGLLEEFAPLLGAGGPEPADEAPPWADFPAFRVEGVGRTIGWGARVADAALDAPAWAGPVWAAELEIQPPARGSRVQFGALPSFPALERDLALVVPEAVPAERIETTVRGSAGPLLESVSLFDVYRGAGVSRGVRSLAYRLRFRAADRTLTDREADQAIDRVLGALEELDVRRR